MAGPWMSSHPRTGSFDYNDNPDHRLHTLHYQNLSPTSTSPTTSAPISTTTKCTSSTLDHQNYYGFQLELEGTNNHSHYKHTSSQSLNHNILAYRPRPPTSSPSFDEGFPHYISHRGMMDPSHQTRLSVGGSGQEYPEDPSFETTSDGRIEMAQDEVDAIIRNKRKVRDPKACYACHRRKVKCDRNLPCDSCVKRDHPELCSYERPTKKRRIALSGPVPQSDGGASDGLEKVTISGPNVTVSKQQWELLNQELQQLRENASQGRSSNTEGIPDMEDGNAPSRSDDAEREGIHAPSNQMGTMHLGSRSVLAYMVALNRSKSSRDAAHTLLEENILPKLGLDNESVTYPFVDLWSTDSSNKDINGLCSAIPDDDLCRDFFYAYRDVACTIYPVVPETGVFEGTLNYMLANRARSERENIPLDQNRPLGVSLPWLALAFAVFASGAQSSRIRAKERELTSQVYICCSYQALRMSNFLTHPCLETIEASLIIGNVLSYNMNPGVSYIFLGMTLRMAFSIGLQINCGNFSDHEMWLRRRVWWALAWQDSHFSVSYDRPSSSVLCTPDIPYTHNSAPGNRSYAESMYAIIRLTQEIIRERTLNPKATMSHTTIQRYIDVVSSIVADGVPHLRERKLCIKTTQHLERLALKLHSSYITSELCRPVLKETINKEPPTSTPAQSPTGTRRKGSHTSPQSPLHDLNLAIQLRRECIRNLEGTVAAYVELHGLSEFAARSWIGIQRSISAAFMLGILPESNQEPAILSLLQDLEYVITQRTVEDPAFDGVRANGAGSPDQQGPRKQPSGSEPPLAESPHWARSMARSLNALGKLNATLAGQMPPASHQNVYIPNIGPSKNIYGKMQSQHPMAIQNVTAPRSQYPPLTHLKQEFSPGMGPAQGMVGGGGLNLGPITPDSASSNSDWNYGNLTDRALEYVQPALWG